MMEEAREMMMVPTTEPEEVVPITRGPGRPKKNDEFGKFAKAINIAFKLYSTGDIGDELELIDPSGNPVPNADLIGLISYALTKGHARIGEEAFVRALATAKIPLSWITNDDIRIKVSKAMISNKRKRVEVERPQDNDDERRAKRPRVMVNEERTQPDEDKQEPEEIEDDEVPAKRINKRQISEDINTGKEPISVSVPPERPPLKMRMRRRAVPYTRRKPSWEIIEEDA